MTIFSTPQGYVAHIAIPDPHDKRTKDRFIPGRTLTTAPKETEAAAIDELKKLLSTVSQPKEIKCHSLTPTSFTPSTRAAGTPTATVSLSAATNSLSAPTA